MNIQLQGLYKLNTFCSVQTLRWSSSVSLFRSDLGSGMLPTLGTFGSNLDDP